LGSNENAKLGIGRAFHEVSFANTPIKIDTLSNVAAVALGEEHTIALTKDFRVYGWGQAEHGAIGMRLSNAKVPNEIKVYPDTGKAKVQFA
jgi:alpha-tubulin suppressor-like RCC1 family protein